MTVSPMMAHWFEHLCRRGVLWCGTEMMEFGPQDCDVPRPMMQAIAERVGWSASCVARAYDDGEFNPKRQIELYGIFGVASYKSLDPFDKRSDYAYDLGEPVPMTKKFDIVTNFGTAEHIFNIGNVFKTAYDLLNVGGIMLNACPAFGDIDHGFYNLHPSLYLTLAVHSGFEIADFQYVDDIAAKAEFARRNAASQFDFGSLPLRLEHLGHPGFRQEVHDLFISNGASPYRKRLWANSVAPQVFDYTFVALRRVSAGEWQAPYQYTAKPLHRTYNSQFKADRMRMAEDMGHGETRYSQTTG